MDAMLRQGWITTQRPPASTHAATLFSTRAGILRLCPANFATYPHNVRIAALNLGPKILELGWMEGAGRGAG